jgi:hypothetical protein
MVEKYVYCGSEVYTNNDTKQLFGHAVAQRVSRYDGPARRQANNHMILRILPATAERRTLEVERKICVRERSIKESAGRKSVDLNTNNTTSRILYAGSNSYTVTLIK